MNGAPEEKKWFNDDSSPTTYLEALAPTIKEINTNLRD